MRGLLTSLAAMHAAKGTPERDAYDKKLAMMKDAMGAKSFFLPSLGRTDLSIKFHNRMQIASEITSAFDQFVYFPHFLPNRQNLRH